MSVLQRISFIFWTHIPFKVYSSWPFQTLPYNKNSCAAIPELQRFLQMVNSFGKFIPNFAEVIAPLREFLKKDVVFNLQKIQLDAIGKLKILITSAPILKNFNPNLPRRLKADASSEGLGALLEQNHALLKNLQQNPRGGYSSNCLRE